MSHHLRRPHRHYSRAARPGIPTSGHTQGSIRNRAPPPEIRRRRRQIVAESLQWCSVIPVLIHQATLLLNHLTGIQWCLFWCTVLHVLLNHLTGVQWCVFWFTVLHVLLNHLTGVQWCVFWFTVLHYCWITSVVFSDTCSDSLCYTTAESPQWCTVIPVLIHCATLLLNHLSGVQRYLFWFTVLHYYWITSLVFSDVCSNSLGGALCGNQWCVCVCAHMYVCVCVCVCVCVN